MKFRTLLFLKNTSHNRKYLPTDLNHHLNSLEPSEMGDVIEGHEEAKRSLEVAKENCGDLQQKIKVMELALKDEKEKTKLLEKQLLDEKSASKKRLEDLRKGLQQQLKDIEREIENIDKEERLRGFDRKLSPDRIIGATTEPNGELTFLFKWKGCDEEGLLSVKEANELYPQTVIQFYESKLKWL